MAKGKIILPLAPARYEQADQDRMRRLIEQSFDDGQAETRQVSDILDQGLPFFDVTGTRYGAAPGLSDNSVRVQAAIDDAFAVGGGIVINHTAGDYGFTTPLNLRSNVTVWSNWSVLWDFQAVPQLASQQGVIHASLVDNVKLKGLKVLASEKSNITAFHGCNGVRVRWCQMTQVDSGSDNNTSIVGIYDNPTGAGANSDFKVEHNRFFGTDKAVLVQGRTSGPWALNDVYVTDNYFEAVYGALVSIFGMVKIDIQINRFFVERNILNGKGIGNDGINVQENVRWGKVLDNIVYAWRRDGIRIEDGQSGGLVRNLEVGWNTIRDITDAPPNGVVHPFSRGINFNNGAGGHSEDVIVHHNDIADIEHEGINENSSGNLDIDIADNKVRNTGASCIKVRSEDVSVRKNRCRSTFSVASLEATATASGLVEGNKFFATNGTTTVIDPTSGGLTFRDNVGFPMKPFDTVVANTGQDREFIRDLQGTPGAGAIGSGLAGGGIATANDDRRWAMGPLQLSTDADNIGLIFHIHPSNTAGDALVPSLKLREGGAIVGPHFRTEVATPAQLTANTNDYDPGEVGWLRLSASVAIDFTGFTRGRDGRILFVSILEGSANFTFTHDTASAASSRIFTGTGANVIVNARKLIMFLYDGTSSRWRLAWVS